MLRFKTKLVAFIFSWPFLKRCHLVGVEVRWMNVRVHVCVCCVKWRSFLCVFAGVCAQAHIYMCVCAACGFATVRF